MRKNSNSQFQKGQNTVDASIPRVDIDLTADGDTDDSGSHSTDEDFPIRPPLKRNPKVEPFDEASLPSTQHLLLDFDQDTLRRPPLIRHPRLYDVDDAESPAAHPPFRNPQVEEHEEFPPLPPLRRNPKVQDDEDFLYLPPLRRNPRVTDESVDVSEENEGSLLPPLTRKPRVDNNKLPAPPPLAQNPNSEISVPHGTFSASTSRVYTPLNIPSVEGSLSSTSTIPAQPNFGQKPFVEISRKRMRSLTPPRVFSPPTASTARSAKAPTAIPPKSRPPPASDYFSYSALRRSIPSQPPINPDSRSVSEAVDAVIEEDRLIPHNWKVKTSFLPTPPYNSRTVVARPKEWASFPRPVEHIRHTLDMDFFGEPPQDQPPLRFNPSQVRLQNIHEDVLLSVKKDADYPDILDLSLRTSQHQTYLEFQEANTLTTTVQGLKDAKDAAIELYDLISRM
ncbi:hypothetical protein CPB83DRAFT_888078 [Crepidotus variabilis]|uniref:Uncharacterized protein n=1 Tax=Crepidotus variabilis TaxID=179855 RepID=A0A9P6JX31_9AGAR|nr:hypothetical protein CPB83DRAFT_888078 [Crepidotus variabilis]